MSVVIVRYKVARGRGEENVKLVKAVFEELHKAKPEGLRYASFVADDGMSFTHIAIVDEGVENPIRQTDSFRAFQEQIAERCEEQPAPMMVEEVGSFNFFD